jgi:hypothetical protein
MRRCTALGAGVSTGRPGSYNAGLQASNAQVFASDCRFRGSDTHFDSYGGAGEGARLHGTVAHFVRCDLEGGHQNHCFAALPGQGIVALGESVSWLADCTVRGGASVCGVGAIGLVNTTSTAAEIARCTIAGGTGTTGNGAPTSGPTVTAPLLGLGAATSMLVRGQTNTIHYRTQPTWPVIAAIATDLQARELPPFAQPVLLTGPGLSVFQLLVADAAGDALLPIAVPNVAALQHAHVFVEGVAGTALPLQTSPPLGGVIQ